MMRVMLCVAGLLAFGAAPPAKIAPEHGKLLQVRDRCWNGALKAWKAGKRADALALFRQTLEIESQVQGPWHRDVESTANMLARAHRARGEWREEAAYCNKVIEARKRLFGESHWRTGDARRDLAEALAQLKRTPAQRATLQRSRTLTREAVVLVQKGKLRDAIPLVKQALFLCKEALGEKNFEYARCLSSLASLYSMRGDARAALPLLQRARIILKETLGEHHPGFADGLDNLASALERLGDTRTALPLRKQALAITRETLGEKHRRFSANLNNLALLLQDMADHKAALPLLRQAVSLTREKLGEKHREYALGLNNLGMLLKVMGDHEAALPLLRQAVAVTRETPGEKHPDHARCLSNLALLIQARGDARAALPLLRQVVAITRESLGEKHPDHANSVNSLAGALQEMGDYKAALPLFRQAVALTREARGEKHLDYANRLNNLAALLSDMGDRKAALPLLKHALAIKKELLGEKHPDYARGLNNLGLLLKLMEDRKAALPLLERALAITKETLGKKHPLYATGLNNLALILSEMGNRKAALALHQEAVAITREVLGEKHLDSALNLNNLALLLSDMGDKRKALLLAEQALAIASSHLRDNASVLSDRQQLAAASVARSYLDNRLSLPDLEGHPSAASHVLRWKGSVLLRQQQRRLFLRLTTDPVARLAAEHLRAVNRQLAALRLSPQAARERFAALEKEQDAAQARLSELSAAFREAREKVRPSPESLARALPEGAVLVDYLFHGGQLSAFVHRRGKPVAWVRLGKATPVEEAVQDWRPLLVSGRPARRRGEEVKSLVYSPLEKHLARARVVLVSPDGVLGTVPFAALPGAKPGSYLIEEVAVAVVPVPSAVPEMVKPPKARLAPSLLVAGDLRYEPMAGVAAPPAGEDTRSAPRTGREKFGPLPATRAEMLAVRASFEKLFRKGKPTSLSEGDATKQAIRDALPRSRYAHFATHGWFAPETVRSTLAGGDKARSGQRRAVMGWNPLLLSGMALSDANRDPRPGEEDGILTALEVSEMDLTRLELAVLSACETGLGKVAGGEGILGMQRAFAVAGARTVVASLWKVDDGATRQLMTDFYARAWDTRKIVSRAEALRAAQLAMLKEGKRRGMVPQAEKVPEGEGKDRLPPFYWAAFVLSGDWR